MPDNPRAFIGFFPKTPNGDRDALLPLLEALCAIRGLVTEAEKVAAHDTTDKALDAVDGNILDAIAWVEGALNDLDPDREAREEAEVLAEKRSDLAWHHGRVL